MTLFQVALKTLLDDPHVRRRGLDDPATVTLTFPDGTVYHARPIPRIASEFGQVGLITTQNWAKIISVSVTEVPERPPHDTFVTGYAEDYRVESAELDHFETSWRLDLGKVT